MGKDTMNDEISNALPEVVAPEIPAADKGVTQEVPATSEVANPKQTAEENAAFAAMRREILQLKKDKEKAETTLNGYKSGLKSQGYEGNDEDILAKLYAEAHGVSEAEAKTKLAEADKIKELEDRLAEKDARLYSVEEERKAERRAADLKAIKAAYPDVSVSDPKELGEEFVALMLTGKFDALTAYKAIRAATTKEAPPSIGSVKSGAVQPERDYYTEEELAGIAKSTDKLRDKSIVDKAYDSLFKKGKGK